MNKITKGIVSFVMILVIMFTSYAMDVDTIFGIRASAASYTEKAHSMFEFYKNGAALDRTAISDDELYVFGVFVSNFLMPFQSNVGAMSSDAFVTKMCAMFFGDAYTAQQLADMKYTLGLVQTAQSTRSRMLSVKTHTPVSCDVLYRNFRGFYSQAFVANEDNSDIAAGLNAEVVAYTYEGATPSAVIGNSTSDIVWVSGTSVFDAVLAQLISICPSQAGTYLGTAGNSTSPLYVDCFGNISDTRGTVIVPACMNPYAFYNEYLDNNRLPLSSPTFGACPIQLPINNAFWMGTMLDPQDTLLVYNDESASGVQIEMRYGLLSLPNAYIMADNWTNSTTAVFGLNTVEGNEIGIYFTREVAELYLEAWILASGYSGTAKELTDLFTSDLKDPSKGRLLDYPGLYRVADYMGGTALPVGDVLDDIVLFDTYSTFSDSMASSIHTLSMFTDTENNSWWGENSLTGVKVNSTYRMLIEDITNLCSMGGNYWEENCVAGRAAMAHGCFNEYFGEGRTLIKADVLEKMLGFIDENAVKLDISSPEKVTKAMQNFNEEFDPSGTYEQSRFCTYYSSWGASPSYSSLAWKSGVDADKKQALFNRLLLCALTGEPAFAFVDEDDDIDDHRLQACIKAMAGSTVTGEDGTKHNHFLWWDTGDSGSDSDAITGVPMESIATLSYTGWFSSATWVNHYFLQKASPNAAQLTKKDSIFASVATIVCAIGAVVLTAVLTVCTLGVAAVVILTTVAIACAVVAIGLAVSLTVGSTTRASMASKSSGFGGTCASILSHISDLARHRYSKGAPSYVTDFVNTLNSDSAKGMLKLTGLQLDMTLQSVNAANSSTNSNEKRDKDSLPDTGGTTLDKFFQAYGSSIGSSCPVEVADTYTLNYAFYGPHKGLASSLASVSKVYTENGIVNGNKVSTKVGSYITNDVNMWGGIYYAYMVDILGLNFEGETLKAAQLKTNFPDVSTSMTSKNTLNLQGLLDAGTEEDSEAAETEKRRSLMNRLDELTNLTSSEYRNKLMTQTTNSWLVSTHASICGASESGSTQNIGSGSRYTGYSGYVTTSTLSEMPFTSWVMQYYNIIYAVLLVIIIVLAICMAITGHRSFRMCVFSVVCMAVTLLIPRLSIDTAVAATNNLASDLYKDRFNFWAYSQHLMYLQDLQNTTSEYEFLIVTNMQQAKDYYDSENGVTLKWMSPKKSSYWDSLVGTVEIEGADSDYSGLNLSIFTWLFQGQFRQETYSTDPMATYLYRPYLDIVMTASSNKLPSGIMDNNLSITADTESTIPRLSYTAYTQKGWLTADSGIATDWDIKPAHRSVSPSTGKAQEHINGFVQSGYFSKISGTYAVGLFNEAVSNVAYSHFVDRSDAKRYLDEYPNDEANPAGLAGVDTLEQANEHLKQYYLYTESPYYYFYYMFKDASKRYTGGEESASALLLSKDFFKYRESTLEGGYSGSKHTVSDDTLMDFLDLEGLFTYVIPYLEQSNMYVDEWTAIWGREVSAANSVTGIDGTKVSSDTFKKNLKGIWQMYSPWVDAMYDTTYADGKIRSGGKSYKLKDAINPGYYTDIRPMVFSPADMQRNFVTSSDLSDVESRIMRVLENTYVDLMYLNNYTSFDDEVLFSAMAMTATFNFNKEFSDTALFGENITLYPVGFEVRNFNYDAFLRLALLNTTGESIFSDADIYTTVIENTSFFTGVLLILNDIVAVYVVPAMKLVVLLALFFLGLLVCMFAFVTPPDGIWKWIGKNYLLPYGIFVAALVAHMLVVSLFVGEGVTSVVGQRGITVTTGDPTITIILMLVVNIIYAFGLFQVLRLQLKSFKVSLTGIGAAALGFVAGAAGFVMGQIKGGLGALAGGGRSIGRGIGGRISRNMQRNADAKAYAKANAKYGGLSGDSSGDAAPEAASGRRNGTEEYKGLQRTKAGLGDTSGSSTTSMSHADKIAAKREKYADDVATARAANERDTPVSTSGLTDAQKEHISARSQRMKDDYASKKQSLADMKASYAAKNDEKLNSALEKSAAKTQAAKTKTTARYAAATMRAAEMFGTDSEQYKRIVSKQEAAATKSAERIAAAERKREEKIATQAAAREERANDKVWQKDAALEIKTARLREKIANSSGRYAKLNNAVRTTKQTAQNVAADAKFAARSAADYVRSAGATASEGLRSAGRTASSAARSAAGTVSSGVRTAAGAVSSAGKAAVKTSSAAVRTAASGARAVASAGKA